MIDQTEPPGVAPTFWRRVLTFPVSQMVVAILFIAIPFAVVSTPFNLFVTDKPLRRVGAVLLTAIVLGAYWAYVRRNPGGIRRISNYRKQRLGGHAGERAWIYPDRRSGRNRDSRGGFSDPGGVLGELARARDFGGD